MREARDATLGMPALIMPSLQVNLRAGALPSRLRQRHPLPADSARSVLTPMPTEFTPLSALIGGALIGLAATLLYAMLGRIAGISGIVNAAVGEKADRGWRLAFLFGL